MLWLEGRLHDTQQARFDLSDRGLLLADGLFETMLVSGGVPLYLDFHLDRLMAGAATLRIGVARPLLERAVGDLAAAEEGDRVLRLTVTRGAGVRGLRPAPGATPTVFAATSPWNPDVAFQPVRLATGTIRRNATSPLSRLKTLSYLDNVLALEEAVEAGADDALVLSTEGKIACTSAGNIFALEGNRLATPPVADGVLGGTVRARLLALAPEAGLEPAEISLAPEDLLVADAVFATNSVRLISAVTSIDGARVSPSLPVLQPLADLLCRDIRARGGTLCGINGELARRD